MEKYKHSIHPTGEDSTTSLPSWMPELQHCIQQCNQLFTSSNKTKLPPTAKKKKEALSYIRVYLQRSRKPIWKDKVQAWFANIPMQHLSLISQAELTSTAPVFEPWFDTSSEEMSRKWLSPTATDSLDLPLISSLFSSTHATLNWSSRTTYRQQMENQLTKATQEELNRPELNPPSNSPKISWPLYTFTPAANMDDDPTAIAKRRKQMAVNLCEAKECMGRKEVREFVKALWEWKSPPEVKVKTEEDKEKEKQEKEEKDEKKRKRDQDKEEVEAKKNKQKVRKLTKFNDVTLARKEAQAAKREVKRKLKAEAEKDNEETKAEAEEEKEKEKKEDPPLKERRCYTMRLWFRPAMEQHLHKSLDLYYDLIQLARQIVYESAMQGEKWSKETLQDRCALTPTSYAKLGGREARASIPDHDRRVPYMQLQWEIQQEAIGEVMSAFKSAESNLKKGNTKGYTLSSEFAAQKLTNDTRRFLWLKCTNRMLEVSKTGEVKLKRRTLSISSSEVEDTGLYVKDRYLRHTLAIGHRRPTSRWGHTLKTNECGFEIRLDQLTRRWFLRMAYLSDDWNGPFVSEAKAPKWYLAKRKHLYSPRGGTYGALDPGIRTPFTVCDFSQHQFMDVMPDLVPSLESDYRRIQKAEAVRRHRLPKYGPLTLKDTNRRVAQAKKQRRRHRRRHTKKRNQGKRSRRSRAKSKTKNKERRHRRKCARQSGWVAPTAKGIRKAWDRITSKTREAHNVVSNFLVSKFDILALPEFLSKGMIRKRRKQLKLPPMISDQQEEEQKQPRAPKPIEVVEGSFLHKSTRQCLARYGHFQQRQRLIRKYQADPFHQKYVGLVTEEFTTKQHPFLKDVLHEKIGSNKVWQCPVDTGFTGNRDNVGSFGIGLKTLTQGFVKLAKVIV